MPKLRLLEATTGGPLQVPNSGGISANLSVGRPLNVLLICNYEPHQAATVQDHIKALRDYSAHNVFVYSGLGELPHNLALDRFDAIICHYSVTVASDAYLGPLTSFRLRTYRGLKALFVQDEYRHVDATVDAIEYLGNRHTFHMCSRARMGEGISKVPATSAELDERVDWIHPRASRFSRGAANC